MNTNPKIDERLRTRDTAALNLVSRQVNYLWDRIDKVTREQMEVSIDILALDRESPACTFAMRRFNKLKERLEGLNAEYDSQLDYHAELTREYQQNWGV